MVRIRRNSIPTSSDRARDHLANERTYLAWLRTSVNVMILGLVIAKFVTDKGAGRAELAGLIVVCAGLLLLLYGTERSRRLTEQLESGKFATDHHGPILVASLVAAALVAALIILAI